MQDCLLPIIGISPLLIAGVIAFLCSQSWLSVLVVLVGAIAGAILVIPSGIFWLQMLHRNWFESQAAGFIFVPIILPVYGYLGAVAGASLVAILYGYHENDLPIVVFQAIASCFTVVLSGLIPAAICAIPSFVPSAPKVNNEVEELAIVLIFAIGIGLASSCLASQLAYLLVIQFV
jgi:hypothetical protein